jgi:hypothetical protein
MGLLKNQLFKGLQSFERIAKEGRKYGISLVVISQRPSDVNKTILSQCGNSLRARYLPFTFVAFLVLQLLA